MNKLRIGTRDSALAVWQAQEVQRMLLQNGIDSELVLVKAEGDLNTSTPLHQMGGVGLFTKVLDNALLQHQADIAVHSLKDYPTQAPEGIQIAAVLPRGNFRDLLIPKHDNTFLEDFNSQATIATGSIRRRAQWRHRYPQHQLENLRGNVNTRLKKLNDHDWSGAIFAAAGLERIQLCPDHAVTLDWMVPAPAQGAIGIACLKNRPDIAECLTPLNHLATQRATAEERAFLRTLEGGCSAPIGALVRPVDSGWHFEGVLISPDGQKRCDVETTCSDGELAGLGARMAKQILQSGGDAIMKSIRDAGL
jgi:hydroxymethylbilane synthase